MVYCVFINRLILVKMSRGWGNPHPVAGRTNLGPWRRRPRPCSRPRTSVQDLSDRLGADGGAPWEVVGEGRRKRLCLSPGPLFLTHLPLQDQLHLWSIGAREDRVTGVRVTCASAGAGDAWVRPG